MTKRTLFYSQELIGAGTAEVQSLRSYIQHLAMSHNMKPRALLKTLVEHYPLDDVKSDIPTLLKRWAFHGASSHGPLIQERLEHATGVSLVGSTLSRYCNLLSPNGFTRKDAGMYCPCCVAEGDGLPYGQLLWEVQAVAACPKHRVRLRSASMCGASAAEVLPVSQRPNVAGVCTKCGSVGFKCINEQPEAATDEEVWIGNQVGRLIPLNPEYAARCTPKSLRDGLSELVKHVFGGSVVDAAVRSGLSRSSVCVWIRGTVQPGLPGLLQLCLHANADIVALLAGNSKFFNYDDMRRRRHKVIVRTYNRTPLSDAELREQLLKAAAEPEPPSTAQLARRLGIHEDKCRHKFPAESQALSAASTAHMERVYEQRFVNTVSAYQAAAQALRAKGKLVHAKALQKESGLVAFSQNACRVRALQTVMAEYRQNKTDESSSAA